MITRDQELWGIALWVDRTHGANGPKYIDKQVVRLVESGEQGGVDMWLDIASRYDQLRQQTGAPN